MATNEVILPKNFDIAKISFGQPKQQATGGKTLFISYAGNQFHMQTPEMKAPFGVSVWPSDNGGPDKYSLDVSFDGLETREALQTFFDAIKAIDKRLVADAMENSTLWFKKKYPSVDVIEALYSPSIRYSKDRETGEVNTRYAPTFKMSLPLKDGKFTFPAYGDRRAELDLFELVSSGASKGARCRAIVQLSAVWIVGTKFGLMWKVRQLQLLTNSSSLKAWAFQKTDEDADEELDAEPVVLPAARRAPKPAAAAAAAAVKAEAEDDSDDLPEAVGSMSVAGAKGPAGAKGVMIPDSDEDDADELEPRA